MNDKFERFQQRMQFCIATQGDFDSAFTVRVEQTATHICTANIRQTQIRPATMPGVAALIARRARCGLQHTGVYDLSLPGFHGSADDLTLFRMNFIHDERPPCNPRYRHFISGGALGMDMFAAEAVLELRARHDRLFAQADIITATGHAYTRSAMFRRNHYLVGNADLLLAA